jgi:hypothetical protein
LLTEFNEMRNARDLVRNRKRKIAVRANSTVNSFGAGQICSFVVGWSEGIVQIESTREEGQWLHLRQVFLDNILQPLNDHAHECRAELVVNEAEAGISDFKNCWSRKVVMASTTPTRRDMMEYRGMSRISR